MILTQIQSKTQEQFIKHSNKVENIGTDYKYTFKKRIVWPNVFGFAVLHVGAIYGLYLAPKASYFTILFALIKIFLSGFGVTGGAHRLFAHKAYKATFPLRLLLIVFQTVAGQNSLYIWVRDHRLHHKYSDTDADPHNANRGFFFSHFGWLMSRKHPLVREKGRTIDMTDMRSDPLIMFQYRNYYLLYIIFAIAVPIMLPMLLWNESFKNALFIGYFASYCYLLHATWLVNSAAHIYGYKPYDQYIKPKENTFVALVTGGEGWHNYHHVFPWDYRASELGARYCLTTFLIDMFSKIGFAHSLKTVPRDLMLKRIQRTGDLDDSHRHWTNRDDETDGCADQLNDAQTFSNVNNIKDRFSASIKG